MALSDKKYLVIKSNIDGDGDAHDVVTGEEGVYVIIASVIIDRLEEDTFPERERKSIKKLVIALRTGKWENILEPVNDFLHNRGFNESYVVREYEGEPDYDDDYRTLLDRANELKLKNLIDDDFF